MGKPRQVQVFVTILAVVGAIALGSEDKVMGGVSLNFHPRSGFIGFLYFTFFNSSMYLRTF
jgi:hypothetical protein